MNILITRGDDYFTTVSLKDIHWNPIDLTGSIIKMSISHHQNRERIIKTEELTPSTPTSWEFDIIFSNEFTNTLKPNSYYMDIEITDSQGKVKTPYKGIVTITYDITP